MMICSLHLEEIQRRFGQLIDEDALGLWNECVFVDFTVYLATVKRNLRE